MKPWEEIDKQRLVTFTDALIAIIMTILVLDLKVQVSEDASDRDLLEQLTRQLPHLFGFIVSFAVIAVIWMAHHDLIRQVKQPNRVFAGLNFLFVGAIATVPFSTAFAAEYPDRSIAVATLAGNMLIMNLCLSALFFYSLAKLEIDPAAQFPKHEKVKRIMGVSGTILLLVATFVAFTSPTAALIMIASVPVIHLMPTPH